MKKYICILLAANLLLLYACFEDQDDVRPIASTLEIQEFVWSGLNVFYLYKNGVPDLANDRFESDEQFRGFLENHATPENLFDVLLSSEDRFSVIVNDYEVLEQSLNGIRLNNGMEYGLILLEETNQVFGYVRYVLPNSSADTEGIQRGMLFNRIDGTEITSENYSQLLSANTYTISLAEFDGENLTSVDQSYTLSKQEYTENPVFINKTLTIEGQKIGYLMYNGFTSNFDSDLNAAFAEFQGEGITNLVLDLRYNSGGSIETCNDLCSMITGQFSGELFSTQEYNDNFEDEKRFFNTKISNGETINNLQLNQVYVLTSQNSASASELLISSLTPYIEVIQIGDTTTGKFQGSVTLYDSPDFSRRNRSIAHHYAMQPLILKSVNANGFSDYVNGLPPDVTVKENYANLGVLGNRDEPLLEAAISHILGEERPAGKIPALQTTAIGESKMKTLTYRRMYIENLP